MPRVYTYTTRERRKHAASGYYTCVKCHENILPGQQRYEWSFRYGGTYRRHVACGHPRPSELTQSKMAQVYASTEAVEDLFGGWESPDELEQALDAAADEIDEVAGEYNEAAEHFGGEGENKERAEALEQYAGELRDWSPPDQPVEADGDDEFDLDSWREDVESSVSDVIGQCPY